MTKPIDIPKFLAVIAEALAERADRDT